MAQDLPELNHFAKLHKMYWDCQNWKSILRFIDDGTILIEGISNAYVFVPNTPSLFEELQDYRWRLKKFKIMKIAVRKRITDHEKFSKGLMEVGDSKLHQQLHKNHELLKAQVADCSERFLDLRSEIYRYAISIIKSKRTRY